VNTRSLRIFVEVADSGSFSAAARNMGLTQPAVSFQIRTLEKEYGNTLIDRSTGHCRLTQAGQSFLKYARSILEKEDELREEMKGKRGEVSGPITISASNIPGEYIMPGVLARFIDRYPLADPIMTITDSGRVLESVRSGEVDLGCVGFQEEDSRLRYGLLCEDRLVFIAPSHHALAGRKGLRPADLEGESFLWREEGSGTRSHMIRILADLGLDNTVESSMRLGSTMAVIQAVVAGAGISLVSLWAADVYMRQGQVAELKIKGGELRRDFHYVILRRRPLSSAASALLELIDEGLPRNV
jgi:DNA-binding transcriptional LysR family regulator